jgi:hypothetical protein
LGGKPAKAESSLFQIELWKSGFFFAIGASTMRLVLVCTDGLRQLDSGVFLPNVSLAGLARCGA